MARQHSIQSAVNAVCRRDFQAFVERVFHTLDPGTELERAPYVEVLCDYLAQVARGEIRRLLVTIPPRHLKTVAGSIALPAWVLGQDPARRIMSLSYGQDLSLKYAAQFRTIMQSRWYAHVFPHTAASIVRDTATEMKTRQNGSRLATSLGGTITGLGADMIIIDDLMKAEDARSPIERTRVQDFFGNTLLSRLNDKRTGAIIAIQQRLHEDDLAGHLLQLGGFVHLNLPAIAEEVQVYPLSNGRVFRREVGDVLKPGTEPRSVLDEQRAAMGGAVFEAQYQQNPTSYDSALLEWHRIQTYEEAPPRTRLQAVVQSWDTAMADSPRANFSVGTTWGYHNGSWLLLDLVRVRMQYPDLLAKVRFERNRWRADTILVEKAATGIPLLDDLSRDFRGNGPAEHHARYCARIGITPGIGKEERLSAQVERLYSGHARFPAQANWLPDLKRELLAFPSGTYDDQVDSVSQFLGWSVGHGGRTMLNRDQRPSGERPR
ncbi:MAG: phage terminase large subunit [Novosphingobium sp.]|nr:phage terminase large subunit [Novosphingobium sp.]